jgi:hypothetical protein
MTGARAAFFELDNKIHGTIRFGDGSVVEIEGRRTLVFTCKNGEHHALTGAYFIPRLTTNIISLSQLAKVGCQIVINPNALKIYDAGRKLLAQVRRSPLKDRLGDQRGE